MTTDSDIIDDTVAQQQNEIPAAMIDIIQDLCKNEHIVFKSLQIDDPDLSQSEKKCIAADLFTRSRSLFLLRFGSFLNQSQLEDIERVISEVPIPIAENGEETKLLIEDLKQKLCSKKICIKNRRYVALQDLIKKGDYFSEHEMMQRSPELYQELVGQYLSEEEIKARDSYDVRNTTFSGILMHALEKKERDKVLGEAMCSNTNEDSKTKSNQEVIVENRIVEYEVPSSYQQQWGGFDDEKVACSTSKDREKTCAVKDNKSCINYTRCSSNITDSERDLLRQEFTRLMYEQFLSGKDESFDYSSVDDNVHLDDLKQYSQDLEDSYFEGSDDSHDEQIHIKNKIQATSDESEDELDIYMRHLQNHHTLQN